MGKLNSPSDPADIIGSVECLISVKLDEHDSPEFLRKAPKDTQLKFAAALRAGLDAARKKREEDKKSSKTGDLK